jgi:hypothetical protein
MIRSAQLRFLAVLMFGAYVILNVLMIALKPVTHGMTPLVATAVLVPPMVLAMVYLVIPLARRA